LLKKLVHKGVNLEAKNALKLTYEHLQFQKIFRGLYPGPSLKGGGEGDGKGRTAKEQGRVGPQFTFLATPLNVATYARCGMGFLMSI